MQDFKGLTQIYTGEGKGKSTAAFGLAVRAAGRGMQVRIIQFMKPGGDYGECRTFSRLDGVELFSFGGTRFLKKGEMPDEESLAQARQAVELAKKTMLDSGIDWHSRNCLSRQRIFLWISSPARILTARPIREWCGG